jgi:hypothetical protein
MVEQTKKQDTYFCTLNSINVSDKIEKKGGLSYLSWAYAWGELKKQHPDATYKIYETSEGRIYWTDGNTCWVKTGVIVNGIEHIEYLPILDYKNKPIPLSNVTSFNANTSIQRSVTKAIARHGLGLYIYAGEDIPSEDSEGYKQGEESNAFETKPTASDKEDKYQGFVDALNRVANQNNFEWVENNIEAWFNWCNKSYSKDIAEQSIQGLYDIYKALSKQYAVTREINFNQYGVK